MRSLALGILIIAGFAFLSSSSVYADLDYAVKLHTGDVQPQAIPDLAAKATGLAGKYVLIQFESPVTLADRDRLAEQGISLQDYVPNNTWIAKLTRTLGSSELAHARVRWMDGIKADQKIAPNITQLGIRESAKRPNGRAQFAIIMQRDQDLSVWSERFKADYNAEILGTEPTVNKIDLVLPENSYLQISQLDEVQWIEQGPPPKEETNNSSRDNIGATIVQAAPYNLTGQGVMLSEWDGGRAKGDHPDLNGRVLELDESQYQVHATHVAGTIIGTGKVSSGLYKGMAPGASLTTQLWWGSASEAATEYHTVTVSLNSKCANNSWGYGITAPATQSQCAGLLGQYYSEDATLDNIVRGEGGNPISIVYSAGNQRSTSTSYCGSIGWTYTTVDPLASSKNVIAVGAINSDNSSMTSFSSWGPTVDGRIKPEVVGPGCQTNDDHGVTSCNLTGSYTTMCGTSMSGPAVVGVVALMHQQQHLNFPTTSILPSTIKGILCNSAVDLGPTGPDYMYGFGKVDAVKAVTKIGIGAPSYAESSISTGETQSYDLTVPGSTPNLKVTLVWDDKGGTALSGQALLNDLDLVLVDPQGGEHQVWVLDPAHPSLAATRGVDHVNNIELAEVANPAPGVWRARVTGYNVPYAPQKYSIVFTPDSINTPGATLAYATFGGGNQTRVPGVSAPVDFWVVNTGGVSDSAHIVVSDNAGWLSGTLDTSVYLHPQDSSHIQVSETVPAGALAGAQSIITCRANSKLDTTVHSIGAVTITAAAVYAIHLVSPVSDTVPSPQNLPLSIRIHNNSNAPNTITLTPTNPLGWVTLPTSAPVTIGARDSSDVSFTLYVPAEVADGTIDTVRIVASGNSASTDTARTAVHVTNPVFPPALVSPDTVVYSQSRVYSFSWTGSADSYRLLIATDTNFTSVVRSYPGLTGTSFTLPSGDSLPDNRYYWGVKKYVGTDSSSLQLHPHRIFVDTKKPNPITTVSPANQAILTQKTVTFTFSAATAPGATESPEFSVLQLAGDSGFTVGLRSFSNITGTSFQMPDTLAEGRWYWRVQRSDLAGNVSNPSSAPNFVIDTKAPSVPTPVFPDSNGVVKSAPVAIRWAVAAPPPYAVSREYYYVHVSKKADFTDNSFSGYVYADSLQLNTPLLVQGQQYYWRVKALDSAGYYTAFSQAFNFVFRTYVCGDFNNSGGVPDLSDLSALVSYLTTGAPIPLIPQAVSVNCDAIIDLADLSTLVSYLTGGGGVLCCK